MNGSGHGGLRPSRPPGLTEGTSPEPGRGRLGRPGARSSIHGGTMPPSCRRRKRVPRRRTRHSTRAMNQQSSPPPPRSVDGRVSLHSAAQERAPSTPVRAASKADRCRRNTCYRAWRRRRDAVLPPEHSGWLQQACRNGWSEGSGIAAARRRSPATVAREIRRPGRDAVRRPVGAASPYSLRRLPDCRAE